jgi:CRP-like cAMP-binding protein
MKTVPKSFLWKGLVRMRYSRHVAVSRPLKREHIQRLCETASKVHNPDAGGHSRRQETSAFRVSHRYGIGFFCWAVTVTSTWAPFLGTGDFFGEWCLAGQSNYMATATAIAPTTVLVIEKDEMVRVLYSEHAFSDRFIAYMLTRNLRVEEDLIDQLFNSTEKRLARTLLLLARYGVPGQTHKMLPKVSQEMLAEMIGTTRSRVNLFMNKFRKLGFIRYNGEIQIDDSLLSVVLHE